MNRRPTGRQGFSMVEIMVAIVTLATLGLGGASALSYGGSMIQRMQNRRVALSLASETMEQKIRQVGVRQLEQQARENGDTLRSVDQKAVDGIHYTAVTQVENRIENGNDMVEVTVEVSAASVDPVTLCFKGLVN